MSDPSQEYDSCDLSFDVLKLSILHVAKGLSFENVSLGLLAIGM